jgi:hypothetical protein
MSNHHRLDSSHQTDAATTSEHVLSQISLHDRREAYSAQAAHTAASCANDHLPALTLISSAVRNHPDVFDPNHDGQITRRELQQAAANQQLDRPTATAVAVLYWNQNRIAPLRDDANPAVSVFNVMTGRQDSNLTPGDINTLGGLGPCDRTARNVEATLGYVLSRTSNDRSLFGPTNRVTPDAVQQGGVGDCSFLATLASLASNPEGQNLIRRMIQPQGNNYRVTFPNGQSVVVEPPTTAELGMYAHDRGAGLWPAVLERAYGRLLTQHGVHPEDANTPQLAADNCEPQNPFATLTGRHRREQPVQFAGLTDDQLHARMVQASQHSLAMTVGSGNNPNDMRAQNHAPFAQLVGRPAVRPSIFNGHVYGIDHYDAQNRTVYLRNPHYGEQLLSMPLNQFRQAFVGMNVAHTDMADNRQP